MKEKLSAAGSVLAAILASSCCWAPLLLVGIGAGGAGFASALAPYRPYFTTATLLFLAGAWYLTLRRRPTKMSTTEGQPNTCCDEEACGSSTTGRRRGNLLLSGATLFALVMLAFPQISTALAHNRACTPPAAVVPDDAETVTLRVEGMTCESCEGHLREALLDVPGVIAVDVDYATSSARVTYQRGGVPAEQLRQAVTRIGYRITSFDLGERRLNSHRILG